MPKSKLERLLIFLMRAFRACAMAYMLGISNIVNQESKFMDEPAHKIEVMEKEEDDDPF